MKLSDSVTQLKGVGPKMKERLETQYSKSSRIGRRRS